MPLSLIGRLCMVLWLVACHRAAQPPALTAVDEYARALRENRIEAAYLLMSEDYRQRHSLLEFRGTVRDSAVDLRETLARLSDPDRRIEMNAKMVYGELRDELSLVWEDGAWKIVGDPLVFYPQDTPASALRSMLRAVDLKRYAVVLKFVPKEYQGRMTATDVQREFEGDHREENAKMLQLLASNLDKPVEVHGETARMSFGDHYEVHFKREDGAWKIEKLY